MHIDTGILYYLNGFVGHSGFIDALIVFVASYLAYFIVIGYANWLYFFNTAWRGKAYMLGVMLVSVALSRGVLTEVIRHFFHRVRPYLAHANIHNLITDTAWSFPSGHSTFFYALAMSVYLYDKKWGTWFFVATILMTFGRVAAGVHYPTDILGGAFIGVVTTYIVWRIIEQWRTKNQVAGQ